MPTLADIDKSVLRLGSQGSEVEELQSLLNRYEFHLPENGVFGAWTENAVKSFQLTMFLDSDGIVGTRTWKTLYAGSPVDMPIIRPGANQREVKIIQNILSRLTKSFSDFTPYYAGNFSITVGRSITKGSGCFRKSSAPCIFVLNEIG